MRKKGRLAWSSPVCSHRAVGVQILFQRYYCSSLKFLQLHATPVWDQAVKHKKVKLSSLSRRTFFFSLMRARRDSWAAGLITPFPEFWSVLLWMHKVRCRTHQRGLCWTLVGHIFKILIDHWFCWGWLRNAVSAVNAEWVTSAGYLGGEDEPTPKH